MTGWVTCQSISLTGGWSQDSSSSSVSVEPLFWEMVEEGKTDSIRCPPCRRPRCPPQMSFDQRLWHFLHLLEGAFSSTSFSGAGYVKGWSGVSPTAPVLSFSDQERHEGGFPPEGKGLCRLSLNVVSGS